MNQAAEFLGVDDVRPLGAFNRGENLFRVHRRVVVDGINFRRANATSTPLKFNFQLKVCQLVAVLRTTHHHFTTPSPLKRRMTRPRVSISLTVQISANFIQILILRPRAVFSVLQHALLVRIEAFAWKNALS